MAEPPVRWSPWALYEDILNLKLKPLAEPYAAGVQAHKDGKAFYEQPYDHESADGISWRFGWNASAIGRVDQMLLLAATKAITITISEI